MPPIATPEPTAAWVRVTLTTPSPARTGPPAPGGELILRADRVSAQEDQLLFMVGEDVVFRLDRAYYDALHWFMDRPTFGEWLATHRRQHAKANKPWTPDELAALAREVGQGLGWDEIADRHGRTRRAVESAHRRVAARG